MAISEKDVRHIAKLANLALGDGEVASMSRELNAIVGYVEQLQAVNTDGIDAVAQVTGLVNVTRADEPGTMFSPQQALANAPQADSVAFLVPKAVER